MFSERIPSLPRLIVELRLSDSPQTTAIGNSQIATIITNYNLGVAVGIIIEDNASTMAKAAAVAKNLGSGKYRFNRAAGTMWLHY